MSHSPPTPSSLLEIAICDVIRQIGMRSRVPEHVYGEMNHEVRCILANAALSETVPTSLQDAPRVKRETFRVISPDNPMKMIDVVYAPFAACIEREANALRHDMERGMANHNADLSVSSAIEPRDPCHQAGKICLFFQTSPWACAERCRYK